MAMEVIRKNKKFINFGVWWSDALNYFNPSPVYEIRNGAALRMQKLHSCQWCRLIDKSSVKRAHTFSIVLIVGCFVFCMLNAFLFHSALLAVKDGMAFSNMLVPENHPKLIAAEFLVLALFYGWFFTLNVETTQYLGNVMQDMDRLTELCSDESIDQFMASEGSSAMNMVVLR